MKTGFQKVHRRSRLAEAGYTVMEILVTMLTVVMVGGATIGAYVYGLRMVQYTKPKLSASDEARKAISLLTEEIRSARRVDIGTGSLSSFTAVAPFQLQVGSALRVFPTTNYNQFIKYYWDANEKKLMRTTNGTSASSVVANSVSNALVFKGENHLGQVLTNDFNNRVISMDLQFYQIQFPETPIGTGRYYDYYQLQAKMTRRTLF